MLLAVVDSPLTIGALIVVIVALLLVDLLFFARQPLKREAQIVEAISRMPLVVQAVEVP